MSEFTEKNFNELVEKFKKANAEELQTVKAEIANLQEGVITAESFKTRMDEFAQELDVPGIKEAVDNLAIDLKKVRENTPQKQVTMKEALQNENIKAQMEKLSKGNKNESLTLFLDTKTNVLRSSVTDHTLAFRLSDIGHEAYQGTVIAQQFRQASIGANNNGTIRYVDEATVTRNAATRAEAAAYPESAIVWQEYNLPIEKMADSIPFSYEMMNDVDFVQSELRRLLEVNMAILEDNQVYDGDGVTPNLKGVYTSATAFTDTTPKLQNTSIYDLINILKTKISNGKESKYIANKVLMNPADVLTMMSTKDANDNYVQPPFVTSPAGNMIVNGVEVIETPSVTANTLLIGDFRWGTYYTSDVFEIEMGWVNDQFTKDLMTMKARKRAALLVRTIDATAFYKVADITTALANLTAP